jgi:DNA-binding transcriptional LysR family regulator
MLNLIWLYPNKTRQSGNSGGKSMNTQHLQYLTEIERVRSISQAAENLYIGQPNLSRILRELEESAGFPIFERTSKGVRPTERGEKYLQHARSILREMEAMDALGPRHPVANRFRVCLPRSGELFDLTARYLASLDPERSLDASIRECHVRQALEMLASGEAELGIIRFRTEYREYFEEQTRQRELGFRILGKFRYQLVMAGRHPLAAKQTIVRADLAGFPEIVHGDTFRVPQHARGRRPPQRLHGRPPGTAVAAGDPAGQLPLVGPRCPGGSSRAGG